MVSTRPTARKNITLTPDTPVTYIKGVGPKRAEVLAKVGIASLQDLLYHFPRRYLDRSTITAIAHLKIGQEATVVGKIISQNLVRRYRRQFFQVVIDDGSGALNAVWFNGINYIRNAFEIGETVAMSGKVEFYNGLRFIHPDYDKFETEEWELTLHTARIIALYPSTAELKEVGLDSRGFRRLLRPVFEKFKPCFDEILPREILAELKLLPINTALLQIHFPDNADDLAAAQIRFKFEELFFLQLLLAVRRAGIKAVQKPLRYSTAGTLLKQIYKKLPFELTNAQKKVIHEIWDDLQSPNVMNRLLQGDVGSGKTVVALLCASIAIGNGFQAAVMAPTEILAEQHYRVLRQLGEVAGIKVRLLIGGQKKRERQEILAEIEGGQAELVVGTHALIQENVNFKNLALVIIDEQHRFGVVQRSALIEKGYYPDVLVMTATPIPRTLSLTLYGDMDISVLNEMPAGKGRIITRAVTADQIGTVYDYIAGQLQEGNQAYVVYPLIEKSAKSDLQAAIQGYEYLSTKVFQQFKLALLHGGMSTAEKETIMQNFIQGTVNLLVSTTVIEVGVDNQNATIMLVENAERFGLTQIHQLRGRIGRGRRNGVCILVERKVTELGHQRIATILSTIDGFEISEADLKLRGPGEFYGTKQHGYLKMKIADPLIDIEILKSARERAFSLLKNDPHLRRPENQPIRAHLMQQYANQIDFSNIL
ncbi:MAG: ATP-dependent DNA helicase RecG [Candidatus Neomarinimicrobiota bacterium]